jgi:hypothetical protein
MTNQINSIVQEEKATYYVNNKMAKTIKVRIDEDTVWLTQAQMVDLFETTKQNISLHINNIFKEGELDKSSVVKESLTTAKDRKRYKSAFYYLDVIISFGYRLKSKRGTQFRIWANQVIKDYLLKGYALHQRVESIEKQVWQQGQQLEQLINSALPPKEGIFYDGQIFDAHQFVSSLIRSAKKSIVIIDNYIDDSVLLLFSKRQKGVTAKIYTQKISRKLQLDIDKFNSQYDELEVYQFTKSHDRFLIIDNSEIYFIGASLKDLGKKWFAFAKLSIDIKYLLNQLNKS